ncbi:Proteasome activator complex subunit 4-like [Homarus americanus]|uniref:Proteasome activator complex subunit 4-like n=1 Tax=Homarus americanus TaxID=6706 RepID=A0A8J5JYG3_HOMAM|nr:Proteasome activator complex subunit 4-like [Homarus americanus]
MTPFRRTRRAASRLFSRKKGDTSNAEGVVESMIRVCRPYFPLSSTSEILEEVRPMMCPFDMTMQRAMVYLELFLPTSLPPEKADNSWKLWKDELLGIWNACHNSHFWFWENSMFWLFSRMAWHNIGYVEWEEHLPMVFTKVLRSFRLPVSYKKAHVGKGDGLSQFASAMFIIANLGGGNKTQEHLDRLFKSLESYYHPSNSGPWSRHLHDFLNKLTLLFIRRLHRERYKKPSWEVEVAPNKKLTEEEITAFVRCVQTPTMLTMFSHTGTHDAGIVFHRLSLLRPEIIIPPLLEQLYSSLETTTEPHRLTASLECVVCVARALVKGGKYYPEGQTHVIPLLLQTLPGIDPNDIKKCMVTFQFIYTLVTLVPFVDCSAAVEEYTDLTEAALQRLQTFIKGKMIEIHVAGKFAANMCRSAVRVQLELWKQHGIPVVPHPPYSPDLVPCDFWVFLKFKLNLKGKVMDRMEIQDTSQKVNPSEALKAFVPGVCRLLLALTENEEIQNEEHLDDELLFNLLLLSELVRCSGSHLIKYVPQITQVLTQTLHLKSREGYHLAGSVLRYLLKYLGITMPSEYRSMPNEWDTPIADSLPIRHWGEAGDIYNLGLTWMEPGEVEEAAMTTLVRTFLTPELILLHQVAKGEKEVSREVLQQSLAITLDILSGAGVALPHWDEEPIPLVDMAVKKDDYRFMDRQRELCVNLNSEHFPSNVRKAAADVILELVDKLLSQGSDDTKSLCRAVNIYHGLIFFHGVSRDDFDARWKSFQFIKDALANKLARNKQHIRSLLVERAVLHQESRMLENSIMHLTATSTAIMSSLLHLSTSQYSEVRSKSQNTLNQVFQCFPYSYKLILPDLITCLQVDPTENHEQFKEFPRVKDNIVNEEARTSACERLAQRGNTNHELYKSLVSKIVNHLNSGALHWRTHNMALNLLGCLIRPDVTFPANGVRAFTTNLIHDNIRIRETSIFYIPWILKNQKRKHKKTTIDPYSVDGAHEIPSSSIPGDFRPDNAWMQYDSSHKIKTEEEWEQTKFVEKTYFGWYTWPKSLLVYAAPSQQPPLDRKREELSDEELQIYDFFMHQDNVDKLVSFLSLEENKERDSFNTRRFWMFKGLFRNFGDTFMHMLQGHIKRLAGETHKSSQRCATEIITGMIRGSKHWTFAKHQALWGILKPVLQIGMAKVTVETVEDWGTCMATASADRDPNRLEPLMELLMDDPLRASEGAFNGSSRMYMLMGGLGQQEWRVAELSHRLLEYLRPSLSHPYKSIRDRMGSVLTGIFMYDLALPGGVTSRYPSSSQFIDYILPQLATLIQDSGSGVINDYDTDMKCGLPLPLSQDMPSPTQPNGTVFTDRVVPSMMGLPSSSLRNNDSLSKVLNSMHKGGSSQIPLMGPLVNHLSSLEPSGLLAGLDNKDALRVSAKMKLRENCDISSDIICEPVNMIPSDSVIGVKNNIHENHVKSPANGFFGGSEERKATVRLMNTVCRWLVGQMGRSYNGVTPEIYRFLPHLCQLESVDNDPELRGNCVATLAVISQALVLPSRIPALMDSVTQVAKSSWWRARAAVLSLLQVAVFTNMFTILNDEKAPQQVQELVVGLLSDVRLEVQQMASTVLSGLIHCKFIQAEDKLLGEFTSKLQNGREQKRRRKEPLKPQEVLELHAGVLGLCAYATIKKTLSNFRRTHHDNWRDHKQKFTEDQLVVLTDLLLSPSYYA